MKEASEFSGQLAELFGDPSFQMSREEMRQQYDQLRQSAPADTNFQ